MANALKVTPEELAQIIKKHSITGAQQVEALMKAFDIITGREERRITMLNVS
jgi:hypothetical protein